MLKAGGVAGVCQGHAVKDLVPRRKQAFCVDIFTDAVACLLLKELHQVAAADKELSGESFDGEAPSRCSLM